MLNQSGSVAHKAKHLTPTSDDDSGPMGSLQLDELLSDTSRTPSGRTTTGSPRPQGTPLWLFRFAFSPLLGTPRGNRAGRSHPSLPAPAPARPPRAPRTLASAGRPAPRHFAAGDAATAPAPVASWVQAACKPRDTPARSRLEHSGSVWADPSGASTAVPFPRTAPQPPGRPPLTSSPCAFGAAGRRSRS